MALERDLIEHLEPLLWIEISMGFCEALVTNKYEASSDPENLLQSHIHSSNPLCSF